MNQFGQQGFSGNANGMGQQNRYQPSGYVQSHYQGVSKQAGSIAAQSNSGPVISQLGYSANQGYGQSSSGNSYASNSYSNAQPVLSHFGGSSANQSSQPVISHYGGYQAQNTQQSQPYQSSASYMNQSNMGNSSYNANSQPVISHYGGYQAQQTIQSQHAQPHQSMSYGQQQSQPVISHYGGYQAQNAQNQGGYGMSGGAQRATNYTSHLGNNPVLQSNGYANQGAVVSHTGYSTSGQGQTGSGMMNSSQQRF
jgi:hypothetical protein